MGSFTLGRYIPLDSAVHKMDPRAKIMAMLIMLVAIFFPSGWTGYAVIFCCVAGVILLAELLVSVGTAIAFGGESLSPMGWAGGALITCAALAEALLPPADQTMNETSTSTPVAATGPRTP